MVAAWPIPNLRVVVADDQPACREDVRAILEPLGLQVTEASSGEEALDVLHQEPVHVLVCDMHMPTLNGLETVRLARRFLQSLPCILMSGQLEPSLIRQALEASVYSVLAKPISRHELIYTFNRALTKTYGTALTREPMPPVSPEERPS